MNKISVLTLIDMNPNKLGALEEYALHLSSTLNQKGHFAAVGFSEYPPDWLLRRFEASNIEVLRLSPSNGSSCLIRDLRRAIRKHDINILHATFYECYSPRLIIATLGNGCALMYSDQVSRVSRPSRGPKSIVSYFRNRLYQERIEMIIADAEFIRDCHIQDHFTRREKLTVIYNGVNLKRFRMRDPFARPKIITERDVSPGSPIVVTIAQCIPEKGLNYYIDAARIVCNSYPTAIFFIVGDGPQRPALQQQAMTLGLEKNVIFAGQRVNTEEFLSAADVFVLLSVWEEAFAFSLLEGMASGCPVVASRVGAIPESVQDGVTGILVPPRNARASAEAINALLSDQTLRHAMGQAARQRVEKHFSLDRWVDETIDLYKRTLRISSIG